MWCCVGTGMENHGRYGSFIYTHSENALYVNLFVPSELNWKEKNIRGTQDTQFPNEEGSKLTIHLRQPIRFSLAIRYPKWTNNMKLVINGEEYVHDDQPSSYVHIYREWKDGDVVEIGLPMDFTLEELPGYPRHLAVMRGPVLLGAKTGTENLSGLIADEGRWAHIATGPLEYSFEAPFFIGDKKEITAKLDAMRPVAGKPLSYTNPSLFTRDRDKNLVFEPFYQIHDSRYMVYWLSVPQNEYAAYDRQNRAQEKAKIALDQRTVDSVATGEQQPEKDHLMNSGNSRSGVHAG
jgi:hypothetical protein